MKVITHRDGLAPFAPRSYVAKGSSITHVPLVRCLKLNELNMNDIRCINVDVSSHSTLSTTVCPLHSKCRGHLTTSISGNISLPDLLLSSSETDIGPTDRVHRSLLGYVSADEQLAPIQFALKYRALLSGRRGTIKYSVMGCRPSMGARGVATCNWPTNFRDVFVPRAWMKNIHVYSFPTNLLDGSKLVQGIPEVCNIKDGEYALLGRCPTLSEDSLQTVRLYGWDNPSVGVHPNMCEPTNLDYDGDEVHIFPMVADESVKELHKFMPSDTTYKFTQDAFMSDHRQRSDYFIRSTRSITMDYDTTSPEAVRQSHLARNKLSSWQVLRKRFADRVMFLTSSRKALEALTYSHLKVSDGHIYGRQLRNALFQVFTHTIFIDATFFSTGKPIFSRINTFAGEECVPGFSGVKLSYRISMKITQKILDKAKHKSTDVDALDQLNGLLTREKTREIMVDGRSHPMNREALSNIGDQLSCYKQCMISLHLACSNNGIDPSLAGLQELAYLIFLSTCLPGAPPLTSTSTCKFLSRVGGSPVLVGLNEDLTNMDKYMSTGSTVVTMPTDVRNPLTAALVGNLGDIAYRSIAI